LALAIASGATFVARGYAGDIQGTADLMVKAAEHQGISIVDILQPCVTFNKEQTHGFFQENTYKLDESHDPRNKEAAFKKALEWGEKQIPLGIFYLSDEPSFESGLPQIVGSPLIDNNPVRSDLNVLFEEYV
jgi:2-oxoglutarate/2-oxoacid ferredoxin oxidoreductase subunit beta